MTQARGVQAWISLCYFQSVLRHFYLKYTTQIFFWFWTSLWINTTRFCFWQYYYFPSENKQCCYCALRASRSPWHTIPHLPFLSWTLSEISFHLLLSLQMIMTRRLLVMKKGSGNHLKIKQHKTFYPIPCIFHKLNVFKKGSFILSDLRSKASHLFF